MSGTSWAFLAIVVALFLLKMFLGRPSDDQLSVMKSAVESGGLLLDVRSPGEFSGQHLDGAINIPVGELSGRMGELGDKDRPVVVYCASGARSRAAMGILLDGGFEEVHDLGSWRNWR